jgi:hypothetical protein
MYGKGLTRNPVDHVAGIPFEHHRAAAAVTPPSVDLRPHAPRVKDQNQTSGCTGHGTSTGISTTCRAQGRPLPFEPSERGIYGVARRLDLTIGEPLADNGAMPHQVMRGISAWGIRPSQAPRHGFNTDCTPDVVNENPKLGELEDDAKHVVTGEYVITATGSARVQQIRQALAAGYAVCFGVDVDEAFEAYDGAGIIGAPDPKKSLGGHWLCAVGYRTDAAGRTVLIFRNSWSESWGKDGDGEADEAFIVGMYDVYVMNVREVA